MTPGTAVPLLLYVEDEVLIQQLLVADLEDAGFAVVVANNGAAALTALEAQSHELHGLITDINLGAGPNGWEVARRARELVGGLPVVYVSAAGESEWTSHGVPTSLIITKPFVPTQVVVAIATLLNLSE
jgi:DNA-binding response OmpR family regulator